MPGRARQRIGFAECGALTPPVIFPRFRPVMLSTFKRFASSLCILLTLTVLLVPVQSFGYQDEVDWMWNDTKPTSKGRCKTFCGQSRPSKDFEGDRLGSYVFDQRRSSLSKRRS